MDALVSFCRERCSGDLLPWGVQVAAAAHFGLTLAEVEGAILAAGLLPARYQRNRNLLDCAGQARLFASHVTVIGCGGLGGYVLEELARLGVGRLTAVDADIFEEHNLNRQLFSTPELLGSLKTRAAAERLAAVNPAVSVTELPVRIDLDNGRSLLAGTDCVVDAVDNVATRLALESLCSELGIPLVHGAIAGWYGHVASVLPGDGAVSRIYRHWQGGKGVEQQLGNPSFTPALIASLEVAEVCKILLGQGELLRQRKLTFNLLEMEVEEIPLVDEG